MKSTCKDATCTVYLYFKCKIHWKYSMFIMLCCKLWSKNMMCCCSSLSNPQPIKTTPHLHPTITSDIRLTPTSLPAFHFSSDIMILQWMLGRSKHLDCIVAKGNSVYIVKKQSTYLSVELITFFLLE